MVLLDPTQGATDNKNKNKKGVIDFFDVYLQSENAKLNMDIIDPEAWYKTYPFEIIVINKEENYSYDPDLADIDSGITQYVYSLPIPPEAISVNMMVASQATPTLGGVVEETNENKFWLISMQGTVGLSTNRNNPISDITDTVNPATKFRETKRNLGLVSGALDRFVTLSQTGVDLYNDLKNGENIEAANKLFTTNPIFTESAVSRKSNGYYEMHLLHRFLYTYSSLKNQSPNNWFLVFRHHKDGTEWRAVLQEFRMTKTKNNPYLYRYNLMFKGWDMNPILQNTPFQDRFAEGGDLHGLKTFTVTGAFTKLANLTQTIASGPGAIVDALGSKNPVI